MKASNRCHIKYYTKECNITKYLNHILFSVRIFYSSLSDKSLPLFFNPALSNMLIPSSKIVQSYLGLFLRIIPCITLMNFKKSLYDVGKLCAKSKPFPITKIFKMIPLSLIARITVVSIKPILATSERKS